MTLVDPRVPVVVQGVTGRVAARQVELMRGYGTNVVAGVAPGKAGAGPADVPVYDTVAAAVDQTGARASVAFLPPPAVLDGLLEASEAGLELCVSVTEGAPLHDLLLGLEAARHSGMRVIGPNCPGLAVVGECLLGFLPVEGVPSGGCAVLSRSGTLSYEVVNLLARAGLGVSLWVGVGGDRVKGTAFVDVLPDVVADERTDAVVLIGEIGGTDEQDAAGYLAEQELPAVALIAGGSAPAGVALGHAGAIVDDGGASQPEKRAALAAAGVHVVDRPAQIPDAVRSLRAARTRRA